MHLPYIVKYSIKRIVLLLVTAFIILTITFFLVKMLPDPPISGNEVSQYSFCLDQVSLGYYFDSPIELEGYGQTMMNPYLDPQGVWHYFYKEPIIDQYGAWLTNIFTKWNWGTSTAVEVGNSAIGIIGDRIQPTILINVFALIFSLPLGFLFGIIAALNKNKPIDHFISTLVMVFISVPSFVVISLLLLWLGYNGSLPTGWPVTSDAPIGEQAAAMVIPVLSLMFGTIATFTRYTRAELCEVMSSEFLLLARTKGLSKFNCIIRHALRNSLVPLVPMIIGQFVGILSGSIVLEQLYNIPGIGQLFIQCINLRDYNVLLVDMSIFTLISLFASLLVDLSYGIVDPRIRMGAKAS